MLRNNEVSPDVLSKKKIIVTSLVKFGENRLCYSTINLI